MGSKGANVSAGEAFLAAGNCPCGSSQEEAALGRALDAVLSQDLRGGLMAMLGGYQRILADNRRRDEWNGVLGKVQTLFQCGRAVPLDGPMIGVSFGLRDSDYFRETARAFGRDRSAIANLEWMATCWNVTFGATGLWMGKTFEPVPQVVFRRKCGGAPGMMTAYDAATARIGRNFFRPPADPNLLQGLGLPALEKLWKLKERPRDTAEQGFEGTLLVENLEKEKYIPYTHTGGLFLALPGTSVLGELRGKKVYQLNYRWPELDPVYPMTRLVDEIVQIGEGVYLGQLVMATKHYGLGALRIPLPGSHAFEWQMGEAYSGGPGAPDYGYQNNGFFLMIDPAHAGEAYADEAFAFLRPRAGEAGYKELGYDRVSAPVKAAGADWATGWTRDEALRAKFTTFCLEESPRGAADGDVRELVEEGESVLQMIQRIQKEVSTASRMEDHLRHFEKLNRLFRCGVAPRVVDGVFRSQGLGYNTQFDAPEPVEWYGQPEPCSGFDYYHGATVNLHLGLSDTYGTALAQRLKESSVFPTSLAEMLRGDMRGPNLLDAVWAVLGRFVFPWAGKSFERVSGRKLSMLLDESADLAERYPERVAELRRHPASWPHYDLVKRNQVSYWPEEGVYAPHLRSGAWDKGMAERDKEFWRAEAAAHWVFGNNLQDKRILVADALMRALDMNYRAPAPSIQALADSGPSPFVRQGYVFLGVGDRTSILPMNNGEGKSKRVFQFHYRYPLVGGPVPIGFCLDELVEIAQGLFLGQLIYSTSFFTPYHSSVDPAGYRYQLFGYFLLLDNTWERHRQAIGFDVNV